MNRAEWDALVEIAKTKKLFLMEAVWTRFFPLTYALQDLLFKEEAVINSKIVLRCLTYMSRNLKFNICGLESSFVLNRDVPDLQERIKTNILISLK